MRHGLLVLTVVMGAVGNAPGGTIHVPGDEPTIQDAINAAAASDEIVVAPGTYLETINFNGKTITVRSSDGPEATIIDANSSGPAVYCAGGVGPATIFQGFTVRGGQGSFGGGMRIAGGSSPTVTECLFMANAGTHGGGMYIEQSNPTVTDCVFESNVAGRGGGMLNVDSNPTVTGCRFTGNSAVGPPLGRGGGMHNAGSSSPLVQDCMFESNFVTSLGGGASNEHGAPVFIRCTFWGNAADLEPGGNLGSGGGMSNKASNATLINCVFEANTTSNVGGGLSASAPDGSVSVVTLFNCLFSGNTADVGGAGVTAGRAYVSLINCTLTANVSGGLGAGVYHSQLTGAEEVTTITNSILWGNVGNGGTSQGAQFDGVPPVINYSDVEGWTGSLGGVGNFGRDPRFVRDPDDGGDGWGVGDNDDFGDLRLRAGTKCIDAGDNSAVPADTFDLNTNGDTSEPVPFDLDYLARFRDDTGTPDAGPPGSGSPIVDMGAFEFSGFTTPADYDFDLDTDGDIDRDDFAFLAFCLSGPTFQYPPGHFCLAADADADQNIDLQEFGVFQLALAAE